MGVAIASDVPLLRSLIQMAIQDAGFNVIGEVGTTSDLLDFCEKNEVAIAILDLHLGEGEFLYTIERILDVDSEIAILTKKWLSRLRTGDNIPISVIAVSLTSIWYGESEC